MKTLTVKASREYDIHIGAGIACGALDAFAAQNPGIFCIVTDSTVAPLYAAEAKEVLSRYGRTETFVFPQGESSKTTDTFVSLLEFFASSSLTRSDTVIALGGGVTGDLAGFAAACYLRGVRVVQVPTTLLAMIDSSVGGKTGVNLKSGKNQAGAFWQPARVICDTRFLSTLPDEVFADGMAEAVKYGMIASEALFGIIENGFSHSDPRLEDMIYECADIKRRLVEEDERDSGARQLLNFGHTFGHAIEKKSGYSVSHGRAVASGMVIACRLSEALGRCGRDTTDRLRRALRANSLPDGIPYPPAGLTDIAVSDKKRTGGEITPVLCERVGKCVLERMPFERLRETVALAFGE